MFCCSRTVLRRQVRCPSSRVLVSAEARGSRWCSAHVTSLLVFLRCVTSNCCCSSITQQAADETFETEREKAKEADALAQIFRISGDLVNTRLLISQVRVFNRFLTKNMEDSMVFPPVLAWTSQERCEVHLPFSGTSAMLHVASCGNYYCYVYRPSHRLL